MVTMISKRSCPDVQSDWDSDESLQWDDFFGTSVDISSSLLNMYDQIAATNINKTEEKKNPRISVLEVEDGHKKRPLSASSMSSSSSSSSSSLPRNGAESKKLSYLASIESLDDELSEDGACSPVNKFGNQNEQNLSQTDRVLLEIVDSERTYVRDLQSIIEGYLKHICEQEGIRLAKQCIKDLFNNIEDIYRFNRSFFEELELCGLDPVAVARCFVKNSFGFAVYTQYCTNYPRTVSVLTELMGNTETAEIFKERQNALHHVLPLGSYLLKPVQRILKYHLLLENIVKYSDKDSDGYPDIKNALSVMTGIAFHINDMKKKHENAIRVQEIQSLLYSWEGEDLTTYGELVAEGAFRMFRAKALRHLFLFDKMLLITKKREEGILCYKTHIMCSNLMLIESIQGEPLCFHVIPFDNPRFQYTFQARNLEQKREWCLQLKRVILENYNVVIPLHARQLVMELGQARQEDDAQTEKTSSRKQLSAPEYLEKRKQERRKSESSLKALKIRKGAKRIEIVNTPKESPTADARGRRMRSISQDNSADNDLNSRWRRASVDALPTNKTYPSDNQKRALVQSVCQSTKSEKYLGLSFFPLKISRHKQLKPSSFGDIPDRIRDEGTSSSTKSSPRVKRPMWNLLKNFVEETTDTETEDYAEQKHYQRLQPENLTIQSDDESEDISGEYVTFYLANSHAWRNHPLNGSTSANNGNNISRNEIAHKVRHKASTPKQQKAAQNENITDNLSELNKLANYDNLIDLWTRLGTVEYSKVHIDGTTDCNSIRRTQSFTDTVPPKPSSSLHHSTSFRQPSTQQEDWQNLLEVTQKFNSKPKQQTQCKNKNSKSNWLSLNFHSSPTKDTSNSKPSYPQNNAFSNYKNFHLSEHNSVTTEGDKPVQVDFINDLEKYMQHTVNNHHSFNFPLALDDRDIATSCSNTPATSTENIHHPDHRIYKESKYSLFRRLPCDDSRVESKPVPLRSAEGGDDEYCLLSYDYILEPTLQQSTINLDNRSVNDIEIDKPKASTNKLVNSLAKAYASVIKHKSKKGKNRSVSPNPLSKHVPLSYSNTLGARIAQPCEAEYCIPQVLLSSDSKMHNYEELTPPEKEPKLLKSELRPDSVLSESSNTTSSSDGEKLINKPKTLFISPQSDKRTKLEHDDTPSDMSDASGDSYYERTFEAFDNALNEDIFRDSAIYSDPDDVDINGVESYVTEDQNKYFVPSLSIDDKVPCLSYTEKCYNLYIDENNLTGNSFPHIITENTVVPKPSSFNFSDIYDIPVKRKVPLKCLYIHEDNLVSKDISSQLKDVSEMFSSIETFCNNEIDNISNSNKKHNITNSDEKLNTEDSDLSKEVLIEQQENMSYNHQQYEEYTEIPNSEEMINKDTEIENNAPCLHATVSETNTDLFLSEQNSNASENEILLTLNTSDNCVLENIKYSPEYKETNPTTKITENKIIPSSEKECVQINRTIKERLKSLEENAKFQKCDITGVQMEGIKSIRQRCQELEKFRGKVLTYKNDNERSIFHKNEENSSSTINSGKIQDNVEINEETKFKGWVKHVVNKLQQDS